MKKYSVDILFSNNQTLSIETDTDLRTTPAKLMNGGYFFITEENITINKEHVKKMDIVENAAP